MKKSQSIIGIVLAAGKGSRFKSKNANKTASLFQNKPLIQFGIDLYKSLCSHVVIVVGAYPESVISAISHNDNLIFAYQRKRLGTGHALITAIKEIEKNNFNPQLVLLGYGDHMMYYNDDVVEKLINAHQDPETAVSIVTTNHSDPSSLAWGRIIRNSENNVVEIIEQKDATEEQRKVTELNAGFYCFNYAFLQNNLKKIKKSPVTGEYYINEFMSLAVNIGRKVKAITVPFTSVGFGINTREELEKSQRLYSSITS